VCGGDAERGELFTGLVSPGEVLAVDVLEGGVRLRISGAEAEPGDSIAVNGVCLTATTVNGASFTADVMNETLRRTSLGAAREGARVNVELPLRPSDRLGGHFVQGHVDGVGEVRDVREDGFARLLEIAAGPELLRYVAEKGSIAVDGVSLTVAAILDDAFTVSLIPETLQRTSLGAAGPGTRVNLEVDILAKYLERLSSAGGSRPGDQRSEAE
jgi:riboflavin synthase